MRPKKPRTAPTLQYLVYLRLSECSRYATAATAAAPMAMTRRMNADWCICYDVGDVCDDGEV